MKIRVLSTTRVGLRTLFSSLVLLLVLAPLFDEGPREPGGMGASVR